MVEALNIPKKKLFKKENIPNMLVILRMCFVPLIVTFLILDRYGVLCNNQFKIYVLNDLFQTNNGHHTIPYTHVYLFWFLAGILFVLASITDWLDGFLARKFNWVSNFGKFWDPVADKVLINSVLICFAWTEKIPVLVPVIMIIRDVAVDADRMVAAKKNIVVAANIYGKLKTVLQMIGIIFIFFICNSNEYPDHPAMYWGIQNLAMYAATIMSVVSGIIYLVNIAKEIKKVKQPNNQNEQ